MNERWLTVEATNHQSSFVITDAIDISNLSKKTIKPHQNRYKFVSVRCEISFSSIFIRIEWIEFILMIIICIMCTTGFFQCSSGIVFLSLLSSFYSLTPEQFPLVFFLLFHLCIAISFGLKIGLTVLRLMLLWFFIHSSFKPLDSPWNWARFKYQSNINTTIMYCIDLNVCVCLFFLFFLTYVVLLKSSH